MSHKKKLTTRNPKGRAFLHCFFTRQHDMSASHDGIMLAMRLARQVLASGDATPDQWIELAGLLNVCGLFAREQKNEAWLQSMMRGADALRSVEGRVRDVGGPYITTPFETDELTQALNTIDTEVIPAMPLVDFVRLSTIINNMVADHYAEENGLPK